jgi:hypothetical protein
MIFLLKIINNNLDMDLNYTYIISGIVILTTGYFIKTKIFTSPNSPRTFDLTLEQCNEIQEILDSGENAQSSNVRLLTPEERDEISDGLLQGITIYVDPDQLSGLDSFSETSESTILLTPQSSNSSLLTNEELDDIQGITFDQPGEYFETADSSRLTNEELAEINDAIDQGEILDEQTQNRLNGEFANIVGEEALEELQLLNENYGLVVENFFFNL